MKTIVSLLGLCLAAILAAAEPSAKPDACCAPAPTGKAACRCAGKTAAEKAACCADGKEESCCAARDEKTAACCAAEPVKQDACCAAATAKIENPESKIQNFTSESLYQLEAAFTDDKGRPVSLGELRGRPVVLAMFFASCNYACPLTVTNMQAIRDQLPAAVRERAAFVLVSFDVARDTPAVLGQYRSQRGLDAGWTLLHGDDGAVRELAALLGVKYKQEASGMFSHSNIVTVLNPEGEIAYQRIGLNGGLEATAAAITASVN